MKINDDCKTVAAPKVHCLILLGEALESQWLKRFVNLSLALVAVFLVSQLYCAG